MTTSQPSVIRPEAWKCSAALLAISFWLSGNGGGAWMALDLLPDAISYSLGRPTETTLQDHPAQRL